MADLAEIGFRADTSELRDAKASLEALGPAAATAEKATTALAGATDKAATAAAKGTTANNNLRAATIGETGAMTQATAATNRFAAANDSAASSAAKLGATTNSLKGQVGNISAQFGDIAVQLAGGQSPFQIALQQGTQLVGIFGNSGLGAVIRGLGSAFLSLLSPLNLLTVGIIAVGGYALQYFMQLANGGEAAKLSLDDQNKLIRSIADSWAANIPAIEAYVAALDQAQQAQEAAAASQLLTSKAAADNVVAIEDLNVKFADLLYNLQAADANNPVINELSSAFSNLRDRVAEGKATQEDFNAVLDAAQSASFDGIAGVNSFIAALQKLMAAAINTTSVVATMNATIAQGANKALNNPATWRGAGNPMANADGTIQNESNPLPFNGPTPGIRPPIELEGLPGQFKADGSLAGAKKGGGGSSAGKLKTELEGINQALQNLNEPFSQATAAYNTLQTAMKNGTISNEQYEQSLKQIQDAFMAAGGSSEQWANIMANSSKKVSNSLDDAKGLVKGFVSDLVGGLRQGKSLWEAFGDAVNNVLNKIIDKLLNNLIDAIFTVNKTATSSAGGSGGGGLLSGFLGLFGGLFSAKGNVFDGGGVQPFAKGGSFTNSIVSQPTLFTYAKGAQMGVMGEKGAEAIMPLKRGPDGSLGVQLHAANGNSVQNNITIAPVIQAPQSSGNDAQDQKNAQRISETVTDGIRTIVREELAASQQYGGTMNPRGYGNQ